MKLSLASCTMYGLLLSGCANFMAGAVGSATPTIVPVFSPAAGTYNSSQTVGISDSTANATIYYTTNGTTPTTSSTKYTGAIAVTSSETVKAIAVATGYTSSAAASASYTITPTAATPAFSIAAGTYTSSQTVTISDATANAAIYYTTTGTTPTSSSTKYTGAITVTSSETVKSIAVATGYATSAAASASYTITPTAATPAFSVAAGTYTTSQTVTISDATANAAIYYTITGTTPNTSSTRYTGAITVASSETVKAIAIATGYTSSAAASASYTITPTAATPAFSVAAGTYTTSQTVTISDSTANAAIYYTTSGATPTSSSTRYTGSITVASSETVKAIAVATGYTTSAAASASYTITPTAATPVFSPVAGTYTSSQTVTISDSTASAAIYYTKDGTTPTSSSSKYITGGITVGATETLKAIAVATGYTNSAAASATYTVSSSFTLTSSAATNGGALPAAYTCDGYGSTLPLTWSDAPAGTVEYALLMSTKSTAGTVKYDWVLYHIPSTTTSLAQDSFLTGTTGVGDDGPGATYDAPCSQGSGTTEYTYALYALSAKPTFTVASNAVTGQLVSSTISSLTLSTAKLTLSYSRNSSTATGSSKNCVYLRQSLAVAESGTTGVACDSTYAYVSSLGLPSGTVSDPTMNGMTTTNLQIPTATDFLGANGWKIPLSAALASSVTSIASGPIGVAINGVPIFNPCTQNGNCTAAIGAVTRANGGVDTCNGHAGRADDYHYHAAPNCLMAEQTDSTYWNEHPVGWLLDGFALFGYSNADGSTPVAKDTCGIAAISGTQVPTGYPYAYAYHVSDTFPFITSNCLSGVPSTDLAKQGAKYDPMRSPPVTPFFNTNMTLTEASDGYQVLQFTSPQSFTATETGSDSYFHAAGTYKIRFTQVTGTALITLLAQSANAGASACWNFEFTDSNGNTNQPAVSYCKANPKLP